VLEAVGEERLSLIETGSADDRVDQHLLEEIALRMAAADPTDGFPNREQFFDDPRESPRRWASTARASASPGSRATAASAQSLSESTISLASGKRRQAGPVVTRSCRPACFCR
jgi:hypothetical protein